MNSKTLVLIFAGVVSLFAVVGLYSLLNFSAPVERFEGAIYADLSFGEENVRIYREKEGEDSKEYVLDWWAEEAEILPLEKTQGITPMDFLFKDEGSVDLFYYSEELSTYYLMNPGGYESIRLVEDSDIEEAAIYQYNSESEAGVISREQCKESTPKHKTDPMWREVTCTGYHKYPENTEEFENGYMRTCFIPITNSKLYVEFDMPVTSIGSEVNNCSYLYDARVLGASLVQ